MFLWKDFLEDNDNLEQMSAIFSYLPLQRSYLTLTCGQSWHVAQTQGLETDRRCF